MATYLFGYIMLTNLQRPGAVKQMTMKELNNANHHDEHYIVRVLNHKTGVAVGPAQLVLTENTYHLLMVMYVNY